MLGLVAFFLFAGYTLVYSAVAAGGRFAATPWRSLREDAYADAAGTTLPAGTGALESLIGGPGWWTKYYNPAGAPEQGVRP